MSKKITLVWNRHASFHSDWIKSIIEPFFTLAKYEPGMQPGGIYLTNRFDDPLIEQFEKCVIDNLWELPPHNPVKGFVLTCQNWFWYNESIWYYYRNYHQFVPKRNHKFKALIPIRISSRPHRQQLLEILGPLLDNCLWSSVGEGRTLPNDLISTDLNNLLHQRLFREEWYNDSDFTIVAETYVTGDYVFVSEKTFKPMAFQHPFVILGIGGTLDYLKKLGFVTFNNIFDESYDLETDLNKKILLIKQQLVEWHPNKYTKETLQRIQHNKNLFFNQTIVHDRIRQEIIEPILNYAES